MLRKLLITLALGFVTIPSAQAASNWKVDAELLHDLPSPPSPVNIIASVQDENGQPVSGLKQNRFSLRTFYCQTDDKQPCTFSTTVVEGVSEFAKGLYVVTFRGPQGTPVPRAEHSTLVFEVVTDQAIPDSSGRVQHTLHGRAFVLPRLFERKK